MSVRIILFWGFLAFGAAAYSRGYEGEGALIVIVTLGLGISRLVHKPPLKHDRTSPQSARAKATGDELRARMKALARPTLRLTPATTPDFSKLGGEPELPAGVAWPMGEKAPRAFLLQVDLAAASLVGAPEWLPTEGKLYVFYDDRRAGFADQVVVIHSLEPPGAPVASPPALPAKMHFKGRRIGFHQAMAVPSLEWLGVDYATIAGDDQDDWKEIADLVGPSSRSGPQHRIGGYPDEIQDARMQLECEHLARGLPPPDYRRAPTPEIMGAMESWRLLLQIDSDRKLGMNWGDGGMLYIFVREEDARAGDFSKTVTLWQTH